MTTFNSFFYVYQRVTPRFHGLFELVPTSVDPCDVGRSRGAAHDSPAGRTCSKQHPDVGKTETQRPKHGGTCRWSYSNIRKHHSKSADVSVSCLVLFRSKSQFSQSQVLDRNPATLDWKSPWWTSQASQVPESFFLHHIWLVVSTYPIYGDCMVSLMV